MKLIIILTPTQLFLRGLLPSDFLQEKRRGENQLDATEGFIAIINFSTCFGHSDAHHQELETILVLLPIWCVIPWLLVVGC